MKKLLLSVVAFLSIGSLSAQNVNIPDASLKTALVNQTNPIIDTNGDGEIQVSEALAVSGNSNTGAIRANNAGVIDATGIEAFVNATYLYINNNSLTALDVSALTNLQSITCGQNPIVSLDVSQNTALVILSVGYSDIATIDLSSNTNLYQFRSDGTKLDSIDLSNNLLLTHLYIRNNDSITTLDISNNLNLTDLRCSGNELTVIDVSLNTNLTYLECGDNDLTVLDLTNLASLETLSCGTSLITTIDLSQNLALKYLTCSYMPLAALDITNNPLLEYLLAYNDSIISIDLSQNPALETLWIHNNQLTTLDVTNLSVLNQLKCDNNNLSKLDLTQNTIITALTCSNNSIDSLDMSSNTSLIAFGAYKNNLLYLNLNNGNNINMSSITIGTNPDLYCVTVDDSLYSETTWRPVYPAYLGVGNQTVFNGDCANSCFVALRTTINETACSSFNFNGQTITATGIYSDTLSSVASCKDSIVKLDLIILNSSTSTMTEASCGSYTSPSGNYVWNTSNTYTDTLQSVNGCDSIITINLTINSANVVTSQNNNVLSANASGATYQWLDCDNGNAVLISETNQTYTATSSGNYSVEVTQNGCVDTSVCLTVVTVSVSENNFAQNLNLYPNPTNGQFSIDLGEDFKQANIQILDLSGRVVFQKKTENKQVINLNFEAPKGIYFVRINTGLKQSTIKLIKQ